MKPITLSIPDEKDAAVLRGLEAVCDRLGDETPEEYVLRAVEGFLKANDQKARRVDASLAVTIDDDLTGSVVP